MKFRLDTQHYINDRLLEPGHIIGDGTDVPLNQINGDQRNEFHPSVNMTPLDDEAMGLFKQVYPGAHMPERDPTKAIPIRGTGDTAKRPPLVLKPIPELEPAKLEVVSRPFVPPAPNQDPDVATAKSTAVAEASKPSSDIAALQDKARKDLAAQAEKDKVALAKASEVKK